VDVIRRDGRYVVVDHVRDAFDVDPSCGDVRRDENLVSSAPEAREGRLPLTLTAVPMDPGHVESRLADLPSDPVRAALRADEDEDRQHVLPPEEADQERGLQVLRDRIDLMADRRRRPMRRRDGDADGIPHDRPGKGLDLRGHGRGEEKGLSLPREGVDDPPDIGKEAHVEHAVGLIEDEDLEPAEVDVPTGHVIEESARGRDDHVDAGAEGVLLGGHADAAIDRVAADLRALREAAEGDLDLGRELAGRREDEGPSVARSLLQESMEDGQKERGRLPGAGLRGPDHVAAGQDGGNRLLLDRRRRLVSEAVDRSEEDRVQTEMIERILRVRRLHRESYGFIGLRIRVTGGLVHGDNRPAMHADLVRKVSQWIAVGPSIALVAIVLAFVNPLIALLIYLALPVLFIAFNPVDSYFERIREDEA